MAASSCRKFGNSLKLWRRLIDELRHNTTKPNVKDTLAYNLIRDQYMQHHVTSEQLCRAKEELHFLGSTYLCLLQSLRKNQELLQQYSGKGERSIEESAHMVSLDLPQKPE